VLVFIERPAWDPGVVVPERSLPAGQRAVRVDTPGGFAAAWQRTVPVEERRYALRLGDR
jgi:hypothetical protein